MIKHNQFIEIRFKNGIFFEAYIEAWSDKRAVLRLPDTNEKVIVFEPKENVLLIKLLNEPKSKPIEKPTPSPDPVPQKPRIPKPQLEQEFEELKESPKDDLSLMRMAELKDELNRLEREEYLKRARSLKPSGMTSVQYGSSTDIKVARAPQHTTQEAERESSDFNSSLQGMFSKEDR